MFDLGGGTFDVSLLSVSGNLIEVKRTNGDPNLGGQDFNNRLCGHILGLFEKEHGSVPSPQDDPVFYADLEARAEQAKNGLTSREEVTVVIRHGDKILNTKITRQEFEDMTADLVHRAISCVEQTLAEARVDWPEINIILPVGGGSRMPKITAELVRISGKNPSQNVEPDYAAAFGAIIAGRIECQRQGRQAEGEAGALPPINIFSHEVTSHPVGVSAYDDQMNAKQNVLLANGTSYPSTQVRAFPLVKPNQTKVQIAVLEGKDGRPEDECVKLGEFHLDNLPAYPDLTERIEITFELDTSGLLTATARDLKSGRTAQMSIEYKSNGGNGVNP